MNEFQSVEPFVPKLKVVCRGLAGNVWDAEDLMQEVLMKVYRSLQQVPNRKIGNAFLARIAKNAWIDRTRKQPASRVNEVISCQMFLSSSYQAFVLETRMRFVEHI